MKLFAHSLFNLSFPHFSIDQIIRSEIGLIIEPIHSQILSEGGYHVTQARSILETGEECAGLGVDRDPKMALLKAISEYFERKAVLTPRDSFEFTSTNGVASHHFRFAAKYAAYYELCERDAFLSHWYSRTPFTSIEVDAKTQKLKSIVARQNFETLFFKTTLGFEECVVCLIVDKFTCGFAVGLSSGRASGDAQKALQEAIINIELGGYGASKEELINELQIHGVTTLQAHRSYWLYKSFLPEWVLTNSAASKKFSPNIGYSRTEFVELAQFPFKVLGAKNESMIPFRVGLPTRIDLLKLTQRVEFDIESQGEWLIHPIP